MAKLYTKNIWTDEVLAGDERYNILDDNGDPIESAVQIELATDVAQAGTAVDADKMNNIENGIDAVDTRVDDLDSAVGALEGRVDGHDADILELDTRTSGINSPGGLSDVLLMEAGGPKVNHGTYAGVNSTIADDSVYAFTPGRPIGVLILSSRNGNYAGLNAIMAYRTSNPPFVEKIVGSADINVTTGVLSGTTGADGKVTVSAHTDGKIYIENRNGGNRSLSFVLFGE